MGAPPLLSGFVCAFHLPVWVPSTPSALLSINMWIISFGKDKNKHKRGRDWPIKKWSNLITATCVAKMNFRTSWGWKKLQTLQNLFVKNVGRKKANSPKFKLIDSFVKFRQKQEFNIDKCRNCNKNIFLSNVNERKNCADYIDIIFVHSNVPFSLTTYFGRFLTGFSVNFVFEREEKRKRGRCWPILYKKIFDEFSLNCRKCLPGWLLFHSPIDIS